MAEADLRIALVELPPLTPAIEALNLALRSVTGAVAGLLEPGDTLPPTALHEALSVLGPDTLLVFTDEDQAIALANDTPYGLAGAVWTKDVHRAHRVAGAIRAGTVWINAYRVVTPNMPFGGFGLSGIGRENGVKAVDEYLEEKSVIVELTGGTRDPFKMG